MAFARVSTRGVVGVNAGSAPPASARGPGLGICAAKRGFESATSSCRWAAELPTTLESSVVAVATCASVVAEEEGGEG